MPNLTIVMNLVTICNHTSSSSSSYSFISRNDRTHLQYKSAMQKNNSYGIPSGILCRL